MTLELEADVVANSGGHAHDDSSRHNNYSGTLSPGSGSTATVSDGGRRLTGNTGTTGLSFRFSSPAHPHNMAGDHTISAKCTDQVCEQIGPKTIWVGIKDLVEIPETDSEAPWNLYGITPSHPRNHFLTVESALNLVVLARSYRANFPTAPLLQLNDASLERGGLFDLPPRWPAWQPGHKSHSYGTAIDIKANGTLDAIPTKNISAVKKLILHLGMNWYQPDLELPPEKGPHFHIYLTGVAR